MKTKKLLSMLLAIITVVTMFSIAVPAYAEAPETTTVSTYCDVYSHPVVTWEKVEGASKYRVYRATKKNGDYTKLKDVTDLSYTDKTAKVHYTYFYKVRVYNEDGKRSEFSNPSKQKALKTILAGDSIMHGVYEYKALKGATFVTRIGVGPYSFANMAFGKDSWGDFRVNGKKSTGLNKLIKLKPDRVFIMLGMNEIDWQKQSTTISNYRKLLKKLKKARPNAEIVVLATSPTARKRSSGNPSLKKVKSYNKAVKKLVKELDLEYYDYTDFLKDSDGYLKKSCNGGDGCHWTYSATKTFGKRIKNYCKTH